MRGGSFFNAFFGFIEARSFYWVFALDLVFVRFLRFGG